MIESEIRGDVALLRLAHGKVSAFDLDLVERLIDELGGIERSEAKALVLTGTGKSFSAGADLFRILDGGESYLKQFLPALTAVLVKLYTFPRPVIAAINGHAIAGGCLLACAADYRLMAVGKGKIGVPELVVGVPFPLIAIEIIRGVVPEHYIHDVVYKGELYSCDEALDRSVVDELISANHLIDHAFEIAKRLAKIPTESFRLTKHQLRYESMLRWERDGEAVDTQVLQAWASPGIQGAIRFYLERTFGPKSST